ncbi:MAG: sulfatase-like hydrolase/transferase [Planctomycetes bacterium]|nr:sulfatase-like hydrolase/transferase [Planctomycetota bacterium]
MGSARRPGPFPQSQFASRYTKEALKVIQEHKDQPFFIYLSHNMPHVPVFASKARAKTACMVM